MSTFTFESRKDSIGASEARWLLSNDPADLLHLYRLKTDKAYYEKDRQGIDQVILVRCGKALELLNIQITAEQLGVVIDRTGETYYHPDVALRLSGTPDGMIHDEIFYDGAKLMGPFPVEVKACGGWQKASERLEHYYPQIQQQMLVTGAHNSVFSLFIGNTEHFRTVVARDGTIINEIKRRARAFWIAVKEGKEPPKPPGSFKYIVPPNLVPKVYDMGGEYEWRQIALEWAQALDGKQRGEDAIERLKERVHQRMAALVNPKQVKIGVYRIGLAKNGALRFTDTTKEDAE